MKTIMIVDDSATILMSMEGILKKAGYLVEKAARADEALKKLQGGVRPDLIITDLNMPGMTGIEMIREIRKIAAFKFKPILMLTTESQEAKRMEAKSAGATGWLVKPVKPEDLLAVVKQVVPGA
ncbi:MAG: response regulator [Magnetococcales bacterium]|nr:response regulator [Magnetococcales bacterium]MBF0114228.1 response regulator [Magnetococcales bacterium]